MCGCRLDPISREHASHMTRAVYLGQEPREYQEERGGFSINTNSQQKQEPKSARGSQPRGRGYVMTSLSTPSLNRSPSPSEIVDRWWPVPIAFLAHVLATGATPFVLLHVVSLSPAFRHRERHSIRKSCVEHRLWRRSIDKSMEATASKTSVAASVGPSQPPHSIASTGIDDQGVHTILPTFSLSLDSGWIARKHFNYIVYQDKKN